jgi:hypothetical protein
MQEFPVSGQMQFDDIDGLDVRKQHNEHDEPPFETCSRSRYGGGAKA